MKKQVDASSYTTSRDTTSTKGADTATRLERRLKKAHTSRQRIFDAIEQGAPYSAYKARAEDLEREIADLEAELAQHQETRSVLPQLPTDSAALFARAVQELETLLADPGLVHQANEHLRELIRRVELRPDPDAPDALAAEIVSDLGALLSAGGVTQSVVDIFSARRQLSVRLGALPHPPPDGDTPLTKRGRCPRLLRRLPRDISIKRKRRFLPLDRNIPG